MKNETIKSDEAAQDADITPSTNENPIKIPLDEETLTMIKTIIIDTGKDIITVEKGTE